MAENLKGHLLVFYSQIWKLDSLNVPQQTALNSKWKGFVKVLSCTYTCQKLLNDERIYLILILFQVATPVSYRNLVSNKQKKTVADKLV